MFKTTLLSIAIAPLLLGVIAVKGRDGRRELAALRIAWATYAVLLIGALYVLRYRLS